MQKEFEMSIKIELKFFLRLQIKQTNVAYAFIKQNCKTIGTPMHSTSTLGSEDANKKLYQTIYKGMIGSLLYLITSILDIVFDVFFCPRETHLIMVKRIFRYLKDIDNLGLCFKKYDKYRLVGYYDVDYARDKIDRKSINRLNTYQQLDVDNNSIWIKHQLEYYNIYESKILLLCDNTTTINLSKNLILY
ncbi:hypothetical protein CR513_19813, partial [Mucuna pruriens]